MLFFFLAILANTALGNETEIKRDGTSTMLSSLPFVGSSTGKEQIVFL